MAGPSFDTMVGIDDLKKLVVVTEVPGHVDHIQDGILKRFNGADQLLGVVEQEYEGRVGITRVIHKNALIISNMEVPYVLKGIILFECELGMNMEMQQEKKGNIEIPLHGRFSTEKS